MHKVLDLIDSIVLPKVVFDMKEATPNCVYFDCENSIPPLEGDDDLIKLINANLVNSLSIVRVGDTNKFVYKINSDHVIERVNAQVREFHIKLWMLVNKKTQWNRTSLKKNMPYAHSPQFKEKTLELFLDAAKYGIRMNTLVKNAEIKPIHKFIASKFQAMVEAQCPR